MRVQASWLMLCGGLFCLLVSACGEEAAPQLAPTRRAEAVAVRAEDPRTRFCDPSSLQAARTLILPTLEGPALPQSGYRWINLWATWCHPCLEEMPRISEFVTRLRADHIDVTPYFVSVDATADLVTQYRAQHAEAPVSARLPDPSGIATLVSSFGLDPGAGIPIHVLVNANNQIICTRTGMINASDYATLRAILQR